MSLLISSRSPVTPFEHNARMMPRSASAIRISRTSRLRTSDHLSCFALWTALPSSLVGRNPHDYYHDSVTLALSGRRPSRVPVVLNVSSAT